MSSALGHTRLEGEAPGLALYLVGLLLKATVRRGRGELAKAVELVPGSARAYLQFTGALLQLAHRREAEVELLAAYRLDGSAMGGTQLLLVVSLGRTADICSKSRSPAHGARGRGRREGGPRRPEGVG